MFRHRASSSSPSAGARHSVAYGRQMWAYAVLIAAIAVLTSPLWVFQAPPVLGSRALFVSIAIAFWLVFGAVAVVAGRDWGCSLTFDTPGRTVTKEVRGPWSERVLWSYSGDRIERVFVQADGNGLPRLLASLWGGGALVIESGIHSAELETLGRKLARCWRVPFQD